MEFQLRNLERIYKEIDENNIISINDIKIIEKYFKGIEKIKSSKTFGNKHLASSVFNDDIFSKKHSAVRLFYILPVILYLVRYPSRAGNYDKCLLEFVKEQEGLK